MVSFTINLYDATNNKLVELDTSSQTLLVSLIQQLDENAKPKVYINCWKPDKTKYESLAVGKGNHGKFRVIYRRYESEFKEHLVLRSSLFRGFRLSNYWDVGFMDMNGGWYLHPVYETVTMEKAIEAALYFFNHGTIDRKRHWRRFAK